MRDVLKRSLGFRDTKTIGARSRRLRLGDARNHRGVHLALGHGVERPINLTRGHGAGGKDSRANEGPAVGSRSRASDTPPRRGIWIFQAYGACGAQGLMY